MNRLCWNLVLAWAVAAPIATAAAPLPDDPVARRCWIESNAAFTTANLREPVEVRFTNLRSGYTVRAPFWVEFGIRGMGVIPAGNANQRAGHHHLLVNTPLPADHREKIPFSDTHRHFGKGQTGTLLDLPPGTHTLRLLFADHEHRPYFAYSPEIKINVEGRRSDPAPVLVAERFAETCPRWYQDQASAPRPAAPAVYVKNLRGGEPVTSPFLVSLGVTGFGVAPAGSKLRDTGHFALAVRDGKPGSRTVLADGRTETMLDLPRGEHELEVAFLGADGVVLLTGAPVRVVVQRQLR
jgi:hypothetical protein